MAGPSSDGLSYVLDNTSDNFTLVPGFLTPYPQGLMALNGNDVVMGSSDPDRISGNEGNDSLFGGAQFDTLLGGQGNDLLSGNGGNDQLLGNNGNDILLGGQGSDLLTGGNGNDVLVGNLGTDTLIGGEDKDVFVLSTEAATTDPAAADIITDFNKNSDRIALTNSLPDTALSLEPNSLTPGSSDTLIRIRQSGAVLGWVTGVSPADLQNRFVVADAFLSPQLSPVRDLGNVGAAQTTGFVGNTNPLDIYRFNLSTTSNLNLVLGNLTGDADVELIQDRNNNNLIDPGETLAKSSEALSTTEQININALSPGTYYVRILQYDTNANYSLNLDAAPIFDPIRGSNTPSFNSRFGYGVVDAAAAVAKAAGRAILPDIPDIGGVEWNKDLVKAPESWSQGYTGMGVVVAVIDSGIDYTHPDLSNNVWNNLGETGFDSTGQNKANNGIDDDGNGFVDDFRGWDFLEGDNNPLDINGHGTHISGIIAAQANGVGVTGVAPGAKIMPLKVLDQKGDGRISNEIAAIQYAVANGADVINLSFGGDKFDARELEAIRNAEQQGVVVISSAGNSSRTTPDYPSRLANEVGIAVGSVDRTRRFSYFSNGAGTTPLNYVVGPGGDGGVEDGGDIYSTVPQSLGGNPYRYFAGTSMATAHVSGVVALVKQANPNLSAADIERILIETANPNGIIA